jgi:hypothetical protein
MSKRIVILFVTILFLSVFFQNAAIAQSRTALPNDFGIELLGKAALYSFSYQRMASSALGLQIGVGALGGGGSDDNVLLVFIPVGAKFYFIQKNGSPFLTGGMVFLNASAESGPFSDSESGNYSYLGLGFEYRATGGFIFRGTAYGLISDGSFFIWPGLHVGYAF